MKQLAKILRFIQFTLDGKLPRLAKKMSDAELAELYMEFSPVFYSPTDPREAAYGALVVYAVAHELKNRYPNKVKIQKWEPLTQINLYEILGAKDE